MVNNCFLVVTVQAGYAKTPKERNKETTIIHQSQDRTKQVFVRCVSHKTNYNRQSTIMSKNQSSANGITIKIKGEDDVRLSRVEVDCSSLFEVVDTDDGSQEFRLCHDPQTHVLDLSPLDGLRYDDDGNKRTRFEFLPEKIYVRDTMQEMFNLIANADPNKQSIIFGFPGVGKSVLTFLAALCCAADVPLPTFKRRKDGKVVTWRTCGVLYIRKTNHPSEQMSTFWIRKKENAERVVTVDFHRTIDPDIYTVPAVHIAMTRCILGEEQQDRYCMHVRSICDGPGYRTINHRHSSDLVTSGGYPLPKDEEWDAVVGLPVSSWKMEDIEKACEHLFERNSTTAIEWFDVCGGNIRNITALSNGTTSIEDEREEYTRIVRQEADDQKLTLALLSTELSTDPYSISPFLLRSIRANVSLETTVAALNYAKMTQVNSLYGFLLRSIRANASLETTVTALNYAKMTYVNSLYGWYFELFGHKVFDLLAEKFEANVVENSSREAGPNCHPFTVLASEGTVRQSVQQLTTPNMYWTPSTSNFYNIDAAIAIGGTLYCIQYTVGGGHDFNYKTFLSDFWDNLSTDFQTSIFNITIVFVVPRGVTFQKIKLQPQDTSKQVPFEYTFADGISVTNTPNDGVETPMDVEDNDVPSVNATWSNDQDDHQSHNSISGDHASEQDSPRHKSQKPNAPRIHFQWEQLDSSNIVNLDKHPLSFMRRNANI